jgi:hypothetical protein
MIMIEGGWKVAREREGDVKIKMNVNYQEGS